MIAANGTMFKPPGSWAGALSAVPDFGLALMYLVTWIAPFTFGEKMLSHLMLVMILEFIILHSSVFLGVIMFSEIARKRKSMTLFGIGAFYTIFVGGFSLAFGVWWPFFAFWGLMLNRLLGVLLGQAPTGEEKLHLGKSWFVGIVSYLVCVAVTSMIPLPPFGVDAAVVTAQELDASGSWVEEPQSVLAFGFLYFTVVALSEMKNHSWLKPPAGMFERVRLVGSRLESRDPMHQQKTRR